MLKPKSVGLMKEVRIFLRAPTSPFREMAAEIRELVESFEKPPALVTRCEQ
jgi:hypothetical protein